MLRRRMNRGSYDGMRTPLCPNDPTHSGSFCEKTLQSVSGKGTQKVLSVMNLSHPALSSVPPGPKPVQQYLEGSQSVLAAIRTAARATHFLVGVKSDGGESLGRSLSSPLIQA